MARGFTLVELLLVLLIVALLASIVAPVVTGGIEQARESTLKETLHTVRKAIDDYYADTGRYPEDLEQLTSKRYIRRIPLDPVTESRDSWVLIRAEDENTGKAGGIIDIRSGSDAQARDGSLFKDW